MACFHKGLFACANPHGGARSSAGEHSLHTGGVTGSIPVAPTIKTQGKSILSNFPWENIDLHEYGTIRENTGENGRKLGNSWADYSTRFPLVLARFCKELVGQSQDNL